MAQWCFINGDFVPEKEGRLHYRDLSIQRGYGVFDFFKVVNRKPVLLNEHLDRFYFSADQMHLPVRYSRQELMSIIDELLQKNGIKDTGVRITLTGGYSADGYQPSDPNLIISVHSFTPPTREQFEKGIRLISYEHQRQLPSIKTIDYLMAIWLQPLVRQHEADDVLYHQQSIITECPRSNIFIVTKENKLLTPSRNILQGVIRNKVIEAAKQFLEVEEGDISLEELKNAEEVFLTSTTKVILPVCKIDEHNLPHNRTISSQLHQAIEQMIQ